MSVTAIDTEAQKRADYIKGLRALADALEKHPEVSLPSTGTNTPLTFSFLSASDPRGGMATAARALPCDWTKKVWEGSSGTAYFDMNGELYGLKLELGAFRDAVCERIVTGTREVTKTVKDPDALAKVPEIEVTETVEDVRWECHSILAPADVKPESEVAA